MKLVSLILALAATSLIYSQETTPKTIVGRTSFYAEAGGPGIMFSANIDSRFKPLRTGWGGRIGIGFVTADEVTIDNNNYYYDRVSVVSIPAQINYIFGKNESASTFEVGGGVTFLGKKLDIMDFYDDKRSNIFGTVSFMYRRQPISGGFSWRAGFTPLIAKGYIQPFGGISVGYNF